MQKINVEILLLVNSISPKNALHLPKTRKGQKNVYEKPKRQPEKTLLLILKCQKCVIKLHHNSV